MSTPATLRPFDSNDFAAFAGVDSSTPLINFQGECAVVVDGKELSITTNGEDFYWQSYQCEATAEAVGNDILAMLFKDVKLEVVVDTYHLVIG